MSVEIKVPRLGWNMEQGVFLGWLKQNGDVVKPGEPLYTLEGDKAVQEIEATDAGRLHVVHGGPRAGDTVEVGTLLGHLLAPAEAAPATPAAAPAIVATATARQERRPAISPRARRVARELGIDWTRVPGSGRAGRIRERDVRAAAAPHIQADERVVPVSPARRTIARRMVETLRTAAPVTLTTTTDATNLVNLRAQFRTVRASPDDVVPTFTDLIVKLAASALQQHPHLNARWEDERIVMPRAVHVGIAVDVEEGLVVPVLRDVLALGLRQLAARSRELIAKARERRLNAAEQEGGTFTVTNLGTFGVDAFTPILNAPQIAILGVGRIRRRPAVIDERVVPRDELTLSLTFDHRAIDGAPAARFLDTLRRMIENPGPSLLT